MPEILKRGQLDAETAAKCMQLGCKLYVKEPVPSCQVKSELDRQKYHSIEGINLTRQIFFNNIPERCPYGFRNFQELYEYTRNK